MEIIVNGQKKIIDSGSKPLNLINELKLTAADQAICVKVNGTLQPLNIELQEGDNLVFEDFSSSDAKHVFWHTSAHLLAHAILRLWPEALPVFGPPIEKGFFYDFGNLNISEEDFPKIEKEVIKIIDENPLAEKILLQDKESARGHFGHNKFKVDIIDRSDEELSCYKHGDFIDLCRGPHLQNYRKIKAFKILKTSGSYWKGDQNSDGLTRIYAISFPDKAMLKQYLSDLEEAKKRDHKVIGPALSLFMIREEAPGLPFILPNGMLVWNTLIDFWRALHKKEKYCEIKTPAMKNKELWERSGHWEHYKENMYIVQIEKREFAVKPMNCPGAMLFFKSNNHSYRELPMRVSEIGHVHRYEASGALSGLMRVRGFHQDDAHIFLMKEQIEEEILKIIELAEVLYKTFGLEYRMELSTCPENNAVDNIDDLNFATESLKSALDKTGRPYKINPGDGAFYGPKIDFHIKDALQRSWQCGTVQLDFSLPAKFELEYVSATGDKLMPVVIHRAIFGSVERFFGILIEHFAGRFPLWISPVQITVVTVADRHLDKANEIITVLSNNNFNVKLDDSSESISKKIRNAELAKTNYIITVGDKEIESGLIMIRANNNIYQLTLEQFVSILEQERSEKSLVSLLSNQKEN